MTPDRGRIPTPQDTALDRPTFVATARLDDESSYRLDLLRRRYFPPHRNFIGAHLTLFHKLSAEGLTLLEGAVTETVPRPFEVVLSSPFPLGRGVAIRVESGRLVSLRNELAGRLHADLSAQDRQPYKPHVTVQNKVAAVAASECLTEICREWLPSTAKVEGIDLWEYLGGPWLHRALLPFRE